jgi:putative acetyltransferase
MISAADFDDHALARFLREHLEDLAPTAPAESRHALDLDALRGSDVRMWVARDGSQVIGTVALVAIDAGHEELKSMRTAPERRGEGIASRLLAHALDDARARGVVRVSLETGSMDFFAPARALYARAGFVPCPAFGPYADDPHSVYMTKAIERRRAMQDD